MSSITVITSFVNNHFQHNDTNTAAIKYITPLSIKDKTPYPSDILPDRGEIKGGTDEHIFCALIACRNTNTGFILVGLIMLRRSGANVQENDKCKKSL